MLFFTRLQSCWRSWHNHAGVEILTVKQQGAGAAVRAFIGRPPTPTDGRARATVSTQLWHRAKPRQQSNSGDTAPLEQPGRLDLSLTAAGERRPREAEPPGPAGPHTSRYVYYRRQAGQRTRQPACLPGPTFSVVWCSRLASSLSREAKNKLDGRMYGPHLYVYCAAAKHRLTNAPQYIV